MSTKEGALVGHVVDCLGVPLAVERGGMPRRVVRRDPLANLRIADMKRDLWRDYWDVLLDNGERLTVFRELGRDRGWYLADSVSGLGG